MAEQLTQDAVKLMNRLAIQAEEETATAQCELFLEAHDDFWCCKENLTTLTDWLLDHKLRPTVENFEKAFIYLTNSGLLLEQADADKKRKAKAKKWTAAEIDKLSSVEYKRLLDTDPDFKKQVDAMDDGRVYQFGELKRTPDRRG